MIEYYYKYMLLIPTPINSNHNVFLRVYLFYHYLIISWIFENLDKLKSVHPAFGKVTKSTVLNGFGAPLHPGALKYYREISVPGIEDFVKRTSN